MDGVYPVICATISFGMGVDKASVRFVIHWDVPQSVAGYYQESGRAGRDGLPSFCRIYYCRKAVGSIEFLLKADIGKARDEHKKEQAMRSFRDFQQVCTYCETVQCRHRLFSNYFGDEPPACRQMCDVCKDRVAAEKALEVFNKLSMNFYTGGRISTEDGSDLYEGGRATMVAQGDGDEGSGDEYGSSSSAAAAQAREATALMIQRQFALRKVAAAREAEMHPTAQLTRVKSAMSTGVKVSGLTNTIRESYLKMLADLMKTNYETCAADAGTQHKLIYADFEDIAIGIEYECFSRNTVLSLYRRSCAVEGNKLKKCTLDGQIVEQLKTHEPRKRKALGGDSKQFEKQVAELDAKINNVSDRKRGAGFKKDLMTQTTLGAFFQKDSATELKPIALDVEKSVDERRISFDDIEPDKVVVHQEKSSRKKVNTGILVDEAHRKQIQAQLELAGASITESKAIIVDADDDTNAKLRREIEANLAEMQRMDEEMRLGVQPKSSSRHHKIKRERSRSKERRRSRKEDSKSSSSRRHKRERSRSGERSSASGRRSRSPKRVKNQPINGGLVVVKREPLSPKNCSVVEPKADARPVKIEPLTPKRDPIVHVKSEQNEIQNKSLLVAVKLEPRRSLSPTATICKQEPRSNSRDRDFADELFEPVSDELQPRRTPSPTPTLCKQEPRSNSRNRDFDDTLFEPPTPDANTKIPVSSGCPPYIAPNSLQISKKLNEPLSTDDSSPPFLRTLSPKAIFKQEPQSSSRVIDFVKDIYEPSSADATNVRTVAVKPEPRRTPSPTPTIIKQEPRSHSRDRDFDDELGLPNEPTPPKEEPRANGPSNGHAVIRVKLESRRSLSPTGTVVSFPLSKSSSREMDVDDASERSAKKRRSAEVDGHRSGRRRDRKSHSKHDPSTSSSVAHKDRSHRHHKESKRRRRSRSASPEDDRKSHSKKKSKKHRRRSSSTNSFKVERNDRSRSASPEDDHKSHSKKKSKPSTNSCKVERNPDRISSDGDDSLGMIDDLLADIKPTTTATTPKLPVLNIEDPIAFEEIADSAIDRQIAEKQRQMAALQRLVEAKTLEKKLELDTKILLVTEHVKSRTDDLYEQRLGTVNLDDWDDDEALSNVPVAQMMRTSRQLLEGERRARGLPAKHRSLTDQLNVTELDELVKPELAVELQSMVAAETDYARMDLSGRLVELEQRFRQQKMPVVLLNRLKAEKKRIAQMVIDSLMPYFKADRIQPSFMFNDIARFISHRFYARKSEKAQIAAHVEQIFVQFPCVTSVDDVKNAKFL